MVGQGRFRALDGGIVESFGGPGLFWYAPRAFADFVLKVGWRLSSIERRQANGRADLRLAR
jgi:hypothetical protein